jgi:hypothetical protein
MRRVSGEKLASRRQFHQPLGISVPFTIGEFFSSLDEQKRRAGFQENSLNGLAG